MPEPLRNPLITNEMVSFRLIQCPECGHAICWLNPRLPNYCTECGKHIFLKLKTNHDNCIAMQADAWLRCVETRVTT